MTYHKDFLKVIDMLKTNGFMYFKTVTLPLHEECNDFISDIVSGRNYVQISDSYNKGFRDRDILSVPTFVMNNTYDFCGMSSVYRLETYDTFVALYSDGIDVIEFSNRVCESVKIDEDDLISSTHVTVFFKDYKKYILWNLSN